MSEQLLNLKSSLFTWKGNFGESEMTRLGGYGAAPDRFTITSDRTGQVRTFEVDTQDVGYQDGWDGEYRIYTDNLWDGIRIRIWNY